MEVSKQWEQPKESVGSNTYKQPDLVEGTKKPSEDRIVMLSDGIFAIAITLLVLGIQITLPDIHANTPQAHAAFIQALTGDFLSNTLLYAVTFAVLASYWAAHRRLMNTVKRVDSFFLLLNLLFLAFVAFFPVVANITKYSQFPEADIVYTVVLAGCGYCSVLLWIYALGNHRLVAADRDVTSDLSRIIKVTLVPTFFLASLLLLFIPHFPPGDVFYSWLLLPVISKLWPVK